MKKILLAIIAIMVMSVSAFAVPGKISQVRAASDGTVLVWILKTDGAEYVKPLVGTPEAIKTMYATVLTAKVQQSDVDLFMNENGWYTIEMY